MKAHDILQAAAGHMNDRATTYDRPQGERSMGATVEAFRAVSGIGLTEEQGWLFMALLKAVRSQQGAYRADSYEDGAAYFALAGEAAFGNRGEPSIARMADDFGQQHTIEPAAAMDDDSPRMQAIAQNGNDGEAYSEIERIERWSGAPSWANSIWAGSVSGRLYWVNDCTGQAARVSDGVEGARFHKSSWTLIESRP